MNPVGQKSQVSALQWPEVNPREHPAYDWQN